MNYKEMFLKGIMPEVKIYDVHGHIGTFAKTTPQNTDYKSLMKSMDRLGIKKTVISSADAIMGKMIYGNDEVYNTVANSEGKIMGYITVNPNGDNGMVEEIKRFENGVMTGIKYHPNYSVAPVNSEKMSECLKYINEKEYILLVHAYSHSQVEEVEETIKKYPGIKFIIAHSGAQSGYKLTAELIKKHENVYCDISMGFPRANLLEYLVEYSDENKIMFGSDTPLTDPAVSIGRVLLSDISDRAKEKILGLNFEEVFRNANI